MGVATNHPNLDQFNIETHGFGIHHFKKPPYGTKMDKVLG